MLSALSRESEFELKISVTNTLTRPGILPLPGAFLPASTQRSN